ncbi:uncharacterized protein BDV14DRAFT_131773 [Aspergillus stella-maris]|uniref:uncharacterized protein n=1 Tax=Aspergillus stella-maris TaxID=1810926 RepID=UPI003CCD36A4
MTTIAVWVLLLGLTLMTFRYRSFPPHKRRETRSKQRARIGSSTATVLQATWRWHSSFGMQYVNLFTLTVDDNAYFFFLQVYKGSQNAGKEFKDGTMWADANKWLSERR